MRRWLKFASQSPAWPLNSEVVGREIVNEKTPNNICDICKKEMDKPKEKKFVAAEFCKPLEQMTQEDWDNFDNLEHEYFYE